jgi:hypothetical protein
MKPKPKGGHEEGSKQKVLLLLLFSPEDMFFRNVALYSSLYNSLYPRSWSSSVYGKLACSFESNPTPADRTLQFMESLPVVLKATPCQKIELFKLWKACL